MISENANEDILRYREYARAEALRELLVRVIPEIDHSEMTATAEKIAVAVDRAFDSLDQQFSGAGATGSAAQRSDL